MPMFDDKSFSLKQATMQNKGQPKKAKLLKCHKYKSKSFIISAKKASGEIITTNTSGAVNAVSEIAQHLRDR